jgi:hypothetical protein
MSNELIETGTTGSVIVAGDQEDDPFAVVFGPARPTLLAARTLKPLRRFSDLAMLNLKQPEKHRDDAVERFEHIPEDAVMYAARKLFAETEPAPEAWLHAAVGLTLDSIPSAKDLPRSFRFGLVDLMTDDETGFSYAVVAMASREIRRIVGDLPPSQAAFLQACVKARAEFRMLVGLTGRLIEVRQNAEDVLLDLGEVKVPPVDEDEEVPF